jgi:hypothetical protein
LSGKIPFTIGYEGRKAQTGDHEKIHRRISIMRLCPIPGQYLLKEGLAPEILRPMRIPKAIKRTAARAITAILKALFNFTVTTIPTRQSGGVGIAAILPLLKRTMLLCFSTCTITPFTRFPPP